MHNANHEIRDTRYEIRKSLDICMIVKNEAENLIRTLPNNIAGADNVIVVDTGSSDNTKEIAASLGAKVFDFKWEGDFSAARNISLSQSSADWILWLDADEYITKEDFEKLREFIDITDSNLARVPIHDSDYGTVMSKGFYYRDKLFKNNERIRFEKPINEQLVFPADVDKKEEKIDVNIFHWGGSLPDEQMKNKNIQRIELYKKAIMENNHDPNYYYLLANKYRDQKKFEHALNNYDEAIKYCDGDIISDINIAVKEDSHLKKAGIYIYEIKEFEKGLVEATSVIKCNPNNIQGYCYIVRSLIELKRYEDAFSVAKLVISLPKVLHLFIMNNNWYWDELRYLQYVECLKYNNKSEEILPFLEEILKSNSSEMLCRLYKEFQGK